MQNRSDTPFRLVDLKQTDLEEFARPDIFINANALDLCL